MRIDAATQVAVVRSAARAGHVMTAAVLLGRCAALGTRHDAGQRRDVKVVVAARLNKRTRLAGVQLDCGATLDRTWHAVLDLALVASKRCARRRHASHLVRDTRTTPHYATREHSKPQTAFIDVTIAYLRTVAKAFRVLVGVFDKKALA